MGLSDGERTDGVYNCINQLYCLRGFRDSEYKQFNPLLNALWPALLASRGSSGYWLIGGALNTDHFNETSFVKTAFRNILNVMSSQKKLSESDNKEVEDQNDYLINYRPNMVNFLETADKWDEYSAEPAKVMKVFLLTENFMYCVNRYHDKLSKSFTKVKDIVAKLQGECFNVFSKKPVFLSGYMAGLIFDKVLRYDITDVVTEWFRKHNLHHHVNIKNYYEKFSEIEKIFKEMRKTASYYSTNSQRRMEIVFFFLGKGTYAYPHTHNELFKMIEAHNENNKKESSRKSKPVKPDLIDLKVIKALCNIKIEENKKLKNKVYARYDYLFGDEL